MSIGVTENVLSNLVHPLQLVSRLTNSLVYSLSITLSFTVTLTHSATLIFNALSRSHSLSLQLIKPVLLALSFASHILSVLPLFVLMNSATLPLGVHSLTRPTHCRCLFLITHYLTYSVGLCYSATFTLTNSFMHCHAHSPKCTLGMSRIYAILTKLLQ